MKVIVRIYDGKLSTGAKSDILEALELEDLLLTTESDIGIVTDGVPGKYRELVFEEEVDVPEEVLE